ncbi:MAG TPA: molybdopterin-dependent oxidoreductase [Thermomicrobiaceae bacterium]|nr:molybdopterin-dependent oxidoreductase [Thermomicrobiaceae bacterium]
MNPGAPSRSAFSTGALAALLVAVVMLVLAALAGAPVGPQLVADRLTALVPVNIFSSVLSGLESAAKPMVFGGVVIGQILLGGLLGLAAAAGVRRGLSLPAVFGGLVAAVWVLLALVIAPIGGIGVAGVGSSGGAGVTVIGDAIDAVVFAGVVALGLSSSAEPAAVDAGRRTLLRVAAFGVPGALAAAYLARFGVSLAEKSGVTPSTNSSGKLVSPITPASTFYVVSKNFVDPTVSLNGWSLGVSGKVSHPQIFQYQQLRARPAVNRVTTLECISNDVGGDYISTGQWTGFALRDLLAEVGLQPSATHLVMRAADDYSDSIPLAAAMHPYTMLVYDLNGAPLPNEHGYPLRMIVPGIFGMKNVKWLKSIEAITTDYSGYWQQRGWSNVATVQTMSRIDVPYDGNPITAGTPTLVGGIAFAGDRGISRVEVSTDGGHTWSRADIQPPPSSLTWVIWTRTWTPAKAGSYTLMVRAWDGKGVPQTTTSQPPLPNGATGLDSIQVSVVAARA